MRNIDFMKHRKFALTVSLVLVIASLVLLLTRGLNLGIDFTGGNVIQTEFETVPDISEVRDVISGIVAKGAMIQHFGEKGIIIRTNEDTEKSREDVVKALTAKYPDMKVTGFEKVGPVVGGELRRQAFIGVTIALVAILIYITLRFQFRFAVVSVVPLVHDVIIALGFFSITQMEIGSSFIAAILTIVGYSLNNTIIILDRRHRESRQQISEPDVSAYNQHDIDDVIPCCSVVRMGRACLNGFQLCYVSRNDRGNVEFYDDCYGTSL